MFLYSHEAYEGEYSSPLQRVYELSWKALTRDFLDRKDERLLREISSILSQLASVRLEDLKDSLFDYRRPVGILLGAYALRDNLDQWLKEWLNEVFQIIIRLCEDNQIGELVGASFLVAKCVLKDSEKTDKVKRIMTCIADEIFGYKNAGYMHHDMLNDLLNIAFFSALANNGLCVEILSRLRNNDQLVEYLTCDLETLAMLLFCVSWLALNGKDTQLKEWGKEKRGELGNKLCNGLREFNLDEQIKHYIKPIDLFSEHQGSVKFKEEDEGLDVFHPNLLSKVILALVESGFDRPYALSKYERDVYQQIKGEIKGYKRVRKLELCVLFALSGLTIPLMYYALVLTGFLSFNIIWILTPLFLFTFTLLYPIWKTGKITFEDLKNLLNEMKKTIIGR